MNKPSPPILMCWYIRLYTSAALICWSADIFLSLSPFFQQSTINNIWWSDSLIVNLEVLFATLLEKLFWRFQWSRGSKLWPNNTVNTKFCVRTFLGAFNNQNCWNCQHSHHHEVLSHLFPFCISICMLYDRLKTL